MIENIQISLDVNRPEALRLVEADERFTRLPDPRMPRRGTVSGLLFCCLALEACGRRLGLRTKRFQSIPLHFADIEDFTGA